ncbi:MAG TPA: hypothetical protein VIJ01_03555 [Candidatus Angelobacter sp.]
MLKQTARFACLALLMFAASATPLTANATQFDTPLPMPPMPPSMTQAISAIPPTVTAAQFDTPLPMPPMPPSMTQVI